MDIIEAIKFLELNEDSKRIDGIYNSKEFSAYKVGKIIRIDIK